MNETETPVKRGRGRPRKSQPVSVDPPPPRKRGRPRKDEAKQAGSVHKDETANREYMERKKEKITATEYSAFNKSYDWFNHELFSGTLPQVMLTFHRHAKMKAFFRPHRFVGRTNSRTIGELGLNPDGFPGKSDEEILSTLVSRMVQVWQAVAGSLPKGSYCNAEWAAMMKEFGLHPTATGMVGGAETGTRVDHLIMEGGAFQLAYRELQEKGFRLNWQAAPEAPQAKTKRASKTKFTCADCQQNAWGKPDLEVTCTPCQVPMVAETTSQGSDELNDENEDEDEG